MSFVLVFISPNFIFYLTDVLHPAASSMSVALVFIFPHFIFYLIDVLHPAVSSPQ